MKFRLSLILAALVALSACSLAEDITPPPDYQSPTPPPTMGVLYPANPPDPAAGAAVFADKCAPCHGAQGLGNGPSAANLPNQPSALGSVDVARPAAPADWYTTVTQGNMSSFMPPFSSLNNTERWNVVAYALSLSIAPGELAMGKTVYDTSCSSCHGTDGRKSPKSDFTNQAGMAKLSQNDIVNFVNKGVDTMPAFENTLSDSQKYAVAAYVRSFTFAPAQLSGVPAASTPAPLPVATATLSGTQVIPAALTALPTSGTPVNLVGSVGGKISDGSSGPFPADLKVVLHMYQHDAATDQFNEISTQEAAVGADGTYQFANEPMSTSQAFYTSVDYANTTYSSDPVVPSAGQATYDLPITIYATSTDSSGLVVDQAHILLDYSQPNVIQVVEFYMISNPGDKTIIASKKGGAIVTVGLPKGYTNLQLQDGQLGDRYVQTGDGFGDTSPVPPSKQQYQLVFAFDLPYNSSFEFSQPFSLNVTDVTFLVSEGVKASGQNLVDGGVRDQGNGGGRFQLYDAGSRQSGQYLTLMVSGQGNAAGLFSLLGSGANTDLLIGISVLGLVLVLSGAWLYRRERSPHPKSTRTEGLVGSGTVNVNDVLDAIIALDDQHQAGNIPEDAYRQRRAELKEKLKGRV